MNRQRIYYVLCALLIAGHCAAQEPADSTSWKNRYKNIVRYNISGALIFGFDKYIIMGYERLIKSNRSISVNFGHVAMPKVISVITDSFEVATDSKRTGYNFSVDYRFYLSKENKHLAPRGVYIGPYYSYNHFTNDKQWGSKNGTTSELVSSNSEFKIHTIGFEAGYQFVVWKRMTIDFVMAGPGIGFYDYKAKFSGNLDPGEKQQLIDALQQVLTEKFPGMNTVFGDSHIDGSGVLTKSTIGYRYLIQIGFLF